MGPDTSGSSGHSEQDGHDDTIATGHQQGCRMQPRGVTDISIDLTMGTDMVYVSSLGLAVTMVFSNTHISTAQLHHGQCI